MEEAIMCGVCFEDDRTDFVIVCENGHGCCLKCADNSYLHGHEACSICRNKFIFAQDGNWIPNRILNEAQKKALCAKEESQEKVDADCRPGGCLFKGRKFLKVLHQQREICKRKQVRVAQKRPAAVAAVAKLRSMRSEEE